MASMPEMNVTLNLDDAVAALAAIRSLTIAWKKGGEADILRDIHTLAAAALKQCQIEAAERAVLKAATDGMRDYEPLMDIPKGMKFIPPPEGAGNEKYFVPDGAGGVLDVWSIGRGAPDPESPDEPVYLPGEG